MNQLGPAEKVTSEAVMIAHPLIQVGLWVQSDASELGLQSGPPTYILTLSLTNSRLGASDLTSQFPHLKSGPIIIRLLKMAEKGNVLDCSV